MIVSPKALRAVATWSPFVCLGFAVWLVWAFATVRDDWDVRAIVGLFYGSLLSALVAHVAAFLLGWSGQEPPPAFARTLRGIVSTWVAITVLWVWCAPLMHPIVAWGFRQVSVWRFGW